MNLKPLKLVVNKADCSSNIFAIKHALRLRLLRLVIILRVNGKHTKSDKESSLSKVLASQKARSSF